MLDEENTERLKEMLKVSGQSLSGFLRALVAEYLETVDELKKTAGLSDDMSKMTLGQFSRLFTGLLSKFQAEGKK
jgi:hypothetical protein